MHLRRAQDEFYRWHRRLHLRNRLATTLVLHRLCKITKLACAPCKSTNLTKQRRICKRCLRVPAKNSPTELPFTLVRATSRLSEELRSLGILKSTTIMLFP